MANVWTHGTWTVRPGKEEAFVAAWTDLARSAEEAFGAVPPTLLRDRDHEHVFVTFGPFPSIDDVEAFRSSDLFGSALGRIRPMLESFEARTLDEVTWR